MIVDRNGSTGMERLLHAHVGMHLELESEYKEGPLRCLTDKMLMADQVPTHHQVLSNDLPPINSQALTPTSREREDGVSLVSTSPLLRSPPRLGGFASIDSTMNMRSVV